MTEREDLERNLDRITEQMLADYKSLTRLLPWLALGFIVLGFAIGLSVGRLL